MAVLVGSKHLARMPEGDTPTCVTAVVLWLPDEEDNASSHTRHTLDTLDLEPVVDDSLEGGD